jgi:hypothetical protein
LAFTRGAELSIAPLLSYSSIQRMKAVLVTVGCGRKTSTNSGRQTRPGRTRTALVEPLDVERFLVQPFASTQRRGGARDQGAIASAKTLSRPTPQHQRERIRGSLWCRIHCWTCNTHRPLRSRCRLLSMLWSRGLENFKCTVNGEVSISTDRSVSQGSG